MAKAIYRIYRPTTFKEVSGQEHVVRTIQNQFAAETIAHAYLFTGPRGVGKTTTARLLAKLVNCTNVKDNEPCNTCDACTQITAGNSLDVYEIDAASHTDVDNVRENIIKSVRFAPNALKKKVYIIDEVHMLSTSAFNALLKTLEEPPEHALFVLATTEIHKVPETIISRCQRFDFRRIGDAELLARLQKILTQEKVEVEEAVLKEVVRHSDGCARDAESLLGQVLALGEKKVGLEQASLVLPMTNMVQVEALIESLLQRNAQTSIERLNETIEQGMDLKYFMADVISTLRDKLLEAVSSGSETELLQRGIEELLKAQGMIRISHIPQLPIELAIVKICTNRQQVVEQAPPKDFKKQEVVSNRPEPVKAIHIPQTHVPVEPEKIQTQPAVEPIAQKEEESNRETVFDSVPVIGIDEVKQKWPQVYEQIKECNASLPLMMKSCEVSNVQGDRVELGFDYDLYVQSINKEKNRKMIEGVIETVMGKKLRIRAVQSKQSKDDDTVNHLLQEFGGSLA